jgi:uncharacterized protein (TIGR03382 family)
MMTDLAQDTERIRRTRLFGIGGAELFCLFWVVLSVSGLVVFFILLSFCGPRGSGASTWTWLGIYAVAFLAMSFESGRILADRTAERIRVSNPIIGMAVLLVPLIFVALFASVFISDSGAVGLGPKPLHLPPEYATTSMVRNLIVCPAVFPWIVLLVAVLGRRRRVRPVVGGVLCVVAGLALFLLALWGLAQFPAGGCLP